MDPNQEQQQKNQGFIDKTNNLYSFSRRFRRRYGTGASLKKAAGKQAAKRGAIFLLSNPIGWVFIGVSVLILFLLFFLLFFTDSESGIAGNCDGISASSYVATTTEPIALTALNCANLPEPLTYQWTTNDPDGILTDSTGISTIYYPSSNGLTDITISLIACVEADPENCFADSILINSSSSRVDNVHFYCQYALSWQSSGCSIANYGCTQASVAMAMSTYRTDTFYNPLKVAMDNGGVNGCTRGTSVSGFNNGLVPYMQNAGYAVGPSVANGTSFNMSQAKNYIDQGFLIVAGGPVWFNSNKQIVPAGHAFLIVGVDPAANTISVFDPTYCPWLDGDSLSKGVRTMVPQTYTCSYALNSSGNPISSNCLGKSSGGNQYVFYITNGGHGWYYARPVKKQ